MHAPRSRPPRPSAALHNKAAVRRLGSDNNSRPTRIAARRAGRPPAQKSDTSEPSNWCAGPYSSRTVIDSAAAASASSAVGAAASGVFDAALRLRVARAEGPAADRGHIWPFVK
eukprot:1925374-Pleurochrysis_carterae.AAC.1